MDLTVTSSTECEKAVRKKSLRVPASFGVAAAECVAEKFGVHEVTHSEKKTNKKKNKTRRKTFTIDFNRCRMFWVPSSCVSKTHPKNATRDSRARDILKIRNHFRPFSWRCGPRWLYPSATGIQSHIFCCSLSLPLLLALSSAAAYDSVMHIWIAYARTCEFRMTLHIWFWHAWVKIFKL